MIGCCGFCKSRVATVALAFAIGAAGVAVGKSSSTSESMHMAGHDAHHAEMQQAMEQMDRGMKDAPMSGDPDRDFASMMIPHHQGAIDMAKVELKYGKDAKLRKMAEGIVKAQEREIKEMRERLGEKK